jgi:hypothetical protein
VVADGEVHVERVEKIVIINGIPSPSPPKQATGGGVQPALPPARQHGKQAAVRERDINELAEEFIRRNRAAFQRGITGDHGGGQMP